MKTVILAFALAAMALPMWPQETSGDHLNISLADPSRPGHLVASCINGRITVHGTGTTEIAVATPSSKEHRTERVYGMHRIGDGLGGLAIDQSGNVVNVNTKGVMANTDLEFQVPMATSVSVKSVMGDVDIDNISGDIEANSTNGRIRLTNISGAAVVHGLNGGIVATFLHVPPDKPMSFSSLNGDIDVTLPADTHARLKMKTTNGETYSDFDIHLSPSTPTQDTRDSNGRHIIFEHGIAGTINGGGTEIQFVTFNGNIRIHKGK